jgi:hypothetical protein
MTRSTPTTRLDSYRQQLNLHGFHCTTARVEKFEVLFIRIDGWVQLPREFRTIQSAERTIEDLRLIDPRTGSPVYLQLEHYRQSTRGAVAWIRARISTQPFPTRARPGRLALISR